MKKIYYFYMFIFVCLVGATLLFFNKGEIRSSEKEILTREEMYELLDLDYEARAGFFFDKSWERESLEFDTVQSRITYFSEYYYPNKLEFKVRVDILSDEPHLSIVRIGYAAILPSSDSAL